MILELRRDFRTSDPAVKDGYGHGLEVGGVEGFGEEVAHLDDFGFALEIGQDNGDVAAEFPDELAAGAAGWSQGVGVGNHRDGIEAALTFAERFEDGDAFGANGQAVGGVFDVATAEDAPRSGAESGTDTEIGKRSMGVLAGLLGDGDEMLIVFVVVRSHRSPLPAQLRFPQRNTGVRR
jgi:hypothetical protein